MTTVDVPAPPPLAAALFGDRLALAARYSQWLATVGVERGLVGPREAARVWDRHLLNCAAVSALIPHGATVVDVGSGAGLPGLPLAIARPDLRVTLVESMLRRTAFLAEVVADLSLDAVEVRRARAEELPESAFADVVTARAVAPIEKLASWALPLAKPSGIVVALKGAGAADEVGASWRALERSGVAAARLVAVIDERRGLSEPQLAVVEVDRWPRQTHAARPDTGCRRTLIDGEPVAVAVTLARSAQALSSIDRIGLG